MHHRHSILSPWRSFTGESQLNKTIWRTIHRQSLHCERERDESGYGKCDCPMKCTQASTQKTVLWILSERVNKLHQPKLKTGHLTRISFEYLVFSIKAFFRILFSIEANRFLDDLDLSVQILLLLLQQCRSMCALCNNVSLRLPRNSFLQAKSRGLIHVAERNRCRSSEHYFRINA